MIWLLLTVPFIAGLAALALENNRVRRGLLLSAAAVHGGLVIEAWRHPISLQVSGWLGLDEASLLFLGITSALFLAAAVSATGTLRMEEASRQAQGHVSAPSNAHERIFTACLLLFLASMTLVVVSRHLGLLWVAVEATTLASAPLIYHHRHKRSLEAAWKYLLICSVGIALALLGNFFLAVSTSVGTGQQIPLNLDDLMAGAAGLDPAWLKAAFLLLLIGYGTKMGLAPMHTWLPDAHSEAPPVVSALLSGALLNCAFLGIMRVQSVLTAAGLGEFGRQQLVLFGLLSMAIAAVFLLTQTDYKRMLAYSSVEHMGVLALGAGLGGVGSLGAALHALNHSMAKAALFLTAGNILTVARTKEMGSVRGLLSTAPVAASMWFAGILAVVGSPPFGLFTSELIILKAAVDGGRWWVAAGYLTALSVAFVAMIWAVVKMVFGEPSLPAAVTPPDRWQAILMYLGPAVLLSGVLLTGLYLPGPLYSLLQSAAGLLGGR
ncbi:NADH dehydrogenase FAD-containing subunit [bacterium]|nr:NADH dehydrogenase FAD-containing subunit [bacterium]